MAYQESYCLLTWTWWWNSIIFTTPTLIYNHMEGNDPGVFTIRHPYHMAGWNHLTWKCYFLCHMRGSVLYISFMYNKHRPCLGDCVGRVVELTDTHLQPISSRGHYYVARRHRSAWVAHWRSWCCWDTCQGPMGLTPDVHALTGTGLRLKWHRENFGCGQLTIIAHQFMRAYTLFARQHAICRQIRQWS